MKPTEAPLIRLTGRLCIASMCGCQPEPDPATVTAWYLVNPTHHAIDDKDLFDAES